MSSIIKKKDFNKILQKLLGKKFKFFLVVVLLLIIFNEIILSGLNKIYNKSKDIIFKNNTKNLDDTFKNLNFSNYVFKEYENPVDKTSTYNTTNYVKHSISNIFKQDKYNLGAYPNVEIKIGEELFKHNKFLPECCMYYSDYSSDRGCPCITPEQQFYLQRRGLNRSNDSFIGESDLKNVYFSPTNIIKAKTVDDNLKNEIFLTHSTYIPRGEELSDASRRYVREILIGSLER